MAIPPSQKCSQQRPQRRRPRVLFAVTGSVAAVKGPEIAVRLVNELNLDVRILLTRGGENFWNKAKDYNNQYWDSLQELLRLSICEEDHDVENCRISMCYADDEWKEWKKLGDPVLHIDLRDWADVLLVAPLSAHTLAKISHGFCDDTLSCVIRAWDFGHGSRPGKPLLLAPAMNTAMWEHPLTQTQLSSVQGFWNLSRRENSRQLNHNNGNTTNHEQFNGIQIIAPQVKTLACGEIGNGALASTDGIVRAVSEVCRRIS